MTTSSDAEAVLKIVTVAVTVVDVEILVKALVIPEAASVGIRGRVATSRSVVATTSHESAAKMFVGILEATSVTAMASRRLVASNPMPAEARLAVDLDASYVEVATLQLPVCDAEETPTASSRLRGSLYKRATLAISKASLASMSVLFVLEWTSRSLRSSSLRS